MRAGRGRSKVFGIRFRGRVRKDPPYDSSSRKDSRRPGPFGPGESVRGEAKRTYMAKRMIATLAVTALFVAALGFVKFKQIQTAIAEGAAFQPPPEAVTTIVATQDQW